MAVDASLTTVLAERARIVHCELIAAGCSSDHVHALVRLAPTIALADAVQRLKGASAYLINQQRLLPHRLGWQAGYWAESLGPSDVEPLRRYILAQRQHHDDSHPAEQWQSAWMEPASGGL
jgi:REP element-mobilizing transposase RayT